MRPSPPVPPRNTTTSGRSPASHPHTRPGASSVNRDLDSTPRNALEVRRNALEVHRNVLEVRS